MMTILEKVSLVGVVAVFFVGGLLAKVYVAGFLVALVFWGVFASSMHDRGELKSRPVAVGWTVYNSLLWFITTPRMLINFMSVVVEIFREIRWRGEPEIHPEEADEELPLG